MIFDLTFIDYFFNFLTPIILYTKFYYLNQLKIYLLNKLKKVDDKVLYGYRVKAIIYNYYGTFLLTTTIIIKLILSFDIKLIWWLELIIYILIIIVIKKLNKL